MVDMNRIGICPMIYSKHDILPGKDCVMLSGCKLMKNESGQVTVLFALLFVVLCGFAALVIDIGRVSVVKWDLQSAADAAALAGVQDLPDTAAAKSAAIRYAEMNGVRSSDVTVTFPDSDKLEVRCTKNVEYTFARLLGFTDTDVTARAVAGKVVNLPRVFTDYAIFSESTSIPLHVGKAGQSECFGVIHTNNTLYLGKHLNVTRVEAASGVYQAGYNSIGSLDDAAPVVTIPEDFKEALLEQVTSAPKKYTGNQTFDGNKLDLNQSIYVEGDVTISGNNITGSGFIYATGNITITGNKVKIGTADEPVFIFSEKNITIKGNNPVMYCIIYAPNGEIDVQKNNWILFGRLIAMSFTEDCLKNNFSITAGTEDFSGIPLDGVNTVKLFD